MADGFKSFDELYKEVIGKEPPTKATPASVNNASKHISQAAPQKISEKLSDPKYGKQHHGSSQKKKKPNNAPTMNKKQKALAASMRKRENERRKNEGDKAFINSMYPLKYAIRCPVHGNMLQMGRTIKVGEAEERFALYYCKACGFFYYKIKKSGEKLTGKIRGYEVRNIYAPLFDPNRESFMNDIVTVRERFEKCVIASGIKLYKSGEPNVTKCPECNKDISDDYEKDVLTVALIDGSTRDMSGSFCSSCGAVVISNDRIRSLEKFCNADYINSVSTKNRKVVSEETVRLAQKKFRPETTTLYVHKGKIKCLVENHDVISVALRIPSDLESKPVVINANYCMDCDRFFISADEYNYYRSIYPIMLIRFEYVSDYDPSFTSSLANKSPLMLAGYSVRADLNYSAFKRQSILRNVIELGILSKHEVINYINYFISMNGKAQGMENAVKKWEEDLDYVRTHKFELQKKAAADNIKRWK